MLKHRNFRKKSGHEARKKAAVGQIQSCMKYKILSEVTCNFGGHTPRMSWLVVLPHDILTICSYRPDPIGSLKSLEFSPAANGTRTANPNLSL